MKQYELNLNNVNVKIEVSGMWASITLNNTIIIDYCIPQFEIEETFLLFDGELQECDYWNGCETIGFDYFRFLLETLKIHELNFYNCDTMKTQLLKLKGC